MRTVAGRQLPDSLRELVDPQRTAILVIDVQNDFLDGRGHFAQHGRDVGRLQAVVPQIEALVGEARAKGCHIVFVRQVTLPDGASDSDAWLYFKVRDGKAPDYTILDSWGAQYFGPTPAEDDIEVFKFRPSAFHGTELARLLRIRGVRTVIASGVLTQGCVLATALDASFHDFYTLVVSDAVASTRADMHEGALTFLRSRYDCPTVHELLAEWRTYP